MLTKLLRCNIPKRYVIVVMTMLGYINNFYLHTNLSMIVVDVTTLKNITNPNGTSELKAEYNWSSKEKGNILSSLGYGRMLSPIGGFLAGRFGGSTIYAYSILVSSLITLFNPFFLKAHLYLYMAANVVHGAAETFAYACTTHIYSRWAPPNERARFYSFGATGAHWGSVVSFLVSGWILSSYKWEVLYYFSGLVSLVWFFVWIFVVKNDPSKDKYISKEELQYIQDKTNNNSDHEKLVYPWKRILKCTPLWACCFAKFSAGCGFTFAVSNLPQYVKDSKNIDIKSIGYISLIPQIFSVLSLFLNGFFSDYMRSHETFSITNIHKFLIFSGLLIGCATYIVVILCPNFYIDIVAITALLFFGNFTLIDLQVILLDLAPKYAAFLHGIVNIFYCGASVVTPTLVGFIVTSHSLLQWNICFVVLSSVYLCSGLIFLKFGSGKQRSWADYKPAEDTKRQIEEGK